MYRLPALGNFRRPIIVAYWALTTKWRSTVRRKLQPIYFNSTHIDDSMSFGSIWLLHYYTQLIEYTPDIKTLDSVRFSIKRAFRFSASEKFSSFPRIQTPPSLETEIVTLTRAIGDMARTTESKLDKMADRLIWLTDRLIWLTGQWQNYKG